MKIMPRWRVRGRPFDPRDRRPSRGEQQQRIGIAIVASAVGALLAYIAIQLAWLAVERL